MLNQSVETEHTLLPLVEFPLSFLSLHLQLVQVGNVVVVVPRLPGPPVLQVVRLEWTVKMTLTRMGKHPCIQAMLHACLCTGS